MGRGRAKAKQTKVARQLKYSSPQTDWNSLQRELAGGSSSSSAGNNDPDPSKYEDDYGYNDYEEYRR